MSDNEEFQERVAKEHARWRYKEWSVCQSRGHTPGERQPFDKTGDEWEFCKFCNTHYRFEQVVRELNAPEPPPISLR